MNASKENAVRAKELLGKMTLCQFDHNSQQFIYEFLEVAIKKLPSEAAFQKEKERRKVKQS